MFVEVSSDSGNIVPVVLKLFSRCVMTEPRNGPRLNILATVLPKIMKNSRQTRPALWSTRHRDEFRLGFECVEEQSCDLKLALARRVIEGADNWRFESQTFEARTTDVDSQHPATETTELKVELWDFSHVETEKIFFDFRSRPGGLPANLDGGT